MEDVWHFHSIHRSFSILSVRADKSLLTWSCFLRIDTIRSVSFSIPSHRYNFSELFSLALPKFVMLMRSLDDAIWNMRSFLKALWKLILDFRFFINVSKILPSVHFGTSSYALCIRNGLRIYAGHLLECIVFCFTFVT